MQTLEQWLDVATHGLCDSAAARVRAEIGEHYLSAIESASREGVDPLDAERRALSALGEAKSANRQYRRVLVTESEARTLSQLTSRWPPVGAILVLGTTAIYAVSVRTSELNYLFVCFAIQTVLRAIPISSIRAGWIVRILRWGNDTLFYTFWFVTAMAFMKSPVQAAGIIVMALGAVHREYKFFVLRRKVPVEQWPRMLWI
jgi:hypothetical protein